MTPSTYDLRMGSLGLVLGAVVTTAVWALLAPSSHLAAENAAGGVCEETESHYELGGTLITSTLPRSFSSETHAFTKFETGQSVERISTLRCRAHVLIVKP